MCLFLCCRADNLEKDEIQTAQDAKRETIIEKIEQCEFYFKKMKDFYNKQIYYEGHERFIRLLYTIEAESSSVDLTVRPHNLFVQGGMARDRKYDLDKIKAAQDNPELSLDLVRGGPGLPVGRIAAKSPGDDITDDDRSPLRHGTRPSPLRIEERDF